MNNQLAIVLTYLPIVFFWTIFLAVVYRYFYNFRQSPINWTLDYKKLITGLLGFRIFYALLLTINQYYIWSQNQFTQLLLNSPLGQAIPNSGIFNKICQLSIVNCQKSGYFIFYSYGRFWLNVFIAIGVAFVFYLFLKFLKKYQERFFEEGETELGFLAALIVGWPNFVVFLPLVFVSVVLISLFRRLVLKEVYTTLGWPFILAVLIMLVFGDQLIKILNLGVLKI